MNGPESNTPAGAGEALLEAAIKYASFGWRVVPVESEGKKPWLTEWQKRASTDVQVIRGWWEQRPGSNVGLATGEASGFFVLDVDPAKGGFESLERLEARYGDLPSTPLVLTGGGGRHYYLRWPGFEVRNTTDLVVEGVSYRGLDIRGTGGQVVAPPSVNAKGVEYDWDMLTSLPEPGVAFADAPAWLLKAVGSPVRPMRFNLPDVIPEGSRDETFTRLAGTMRAAGMDESAIFLAMEETNRTRCHPPLPRAQLEKIAKSVSKYPPRLNVREPAGGGSAGDDWWKRDWSDAGTGARFAARWKGELRYSPQLGWMAFRDGRWRGIDKTVVVSQYAGAMSREMASETGHEEAAEDWKKYAKGLSQARRIGAYLPSAAGSADVHVDDVNAWDGNGWVLNCPNGVVDLRSGSILSTDGRSGLHTKMAGAPYVAGSAAPRWEKFLLEIMLGREDLVAFLQRMVGYMLTGEVSEQALFFAYGDGANGKSLFANTIKAVLGGYGITGAPGLLMASKSDKHTTDLADLRGARFVLASESSEGKSFDEEVVKRLTGSDPIKARLMRQDNFEFQPTHKLLVLSNHKPRVRGRDNGIWRRLRLIPFDARFEGTGDNKALGRELWAEREGILSWAVRGCLDWQEIGLEPPRAVLEAVEEYKAEEDDLAPWIAERCDLGPDMEAATAALYANYRGWAEAQGLHPIGLKKFHQDLVRRPGIEKRSHNGSARGLLGIQTKPV